MVTKTGAAGSKTMLAGSPGFEAPEQLSGTHIGVESDVYTLGAVLSVLFGERPVWSGLSPYQRMFKITIEKRTPTTDDLTPPEIAKVCTSCFQELTSRPSSSNVLGELLNICL